MQSRRGFTLLELSIVLVVIALIVGGVVGGIALRRQGDIRSLVNSYSQIESGLNTFQLKYGMLPGDYTNATTAFPGTYGNGNGDKRIGFSTTNVSENFLAWQHLAMAKMISGSYTGVGPISAASVKTGSLPNSYFNFRCLNMGGDCYSGGSHFGRSGQFIELGASNSSATVYADKALLTPADAKSMDLKMDDGIANSGRVFGIDATGVTSYSCSAPYSVSGGADYNLATTTIACKLNLFYDYK